MWVLLGCFGSSTFANVDNKIIVKRYALFVASNNGGADRAQLRYAESDAMSLAKVFQELGGLRSKNSTILLSPGRRQLTEAIEDLANSLEDLERKQERVEFIFYYSGHSDENGLLLEDGKFEYKKLHEALGEVGADVKIAILDSCQSGAFTRLKGGRRTSPFLINAANQLKGNVYLTASSASEASQESDVIGASFFTHYLVSALRGASDISGDKQITLNEAYQYAFHETLLQTENSQAGAQHPAYNIQIAGAGDLVLTDIETSSTTLVLHESMVGRVYVRDRNGSLIVELNKVIGKEVGVALRPNNYEVLWQQEPSFYSSRISLASGESKMLMVSDFSPSDKSIYRSRGITQQIAVMQKRERKKIYLSAGVFSMSNLYRGGYNYDGPNCCERYSDRIERFTGYQISVGRDISASNRLLLKFYEASGRGLMRGGALGVDLDIFEFVNKGSEKIEARLGLFVFIEKLRNYPEELRLATYTWESSLDYVNYGAEVPIGISLKRKNVQYDVSLNKRIRKYHNPNSITDWLPSFSFTVGYSL